jgi:hypothetical protein
MCDTDEAVGISNVKHQDSEASEEFKDAWSNPTLESYSKYLAHTHQEYVFGRQTNGFVVYGNVSSGDKILVAVSNLFDNEILDNVIRALKDRGASKVDTLILDEGPDREVDYHDEVRGIIRTQPWWVTPRWYDYYENVLNFAKDNGYNMLIHGRGGPHPKTNAKGEVLPYKFEAIPWHKKDVFLAKATIFPPKLNYLINIKTWSMIYKLGRGGKVRVTDPEGTDIQFTLKEKYYDRSLDERGGFGPTPSLGHLFSHPTPPIIEEEDACGVVAGTTSHIARPFPHIQVHLDSGKVKSIEGGGKYGEEWRELLEQTNGTQYPEFPRKGLFWLWELAIGTNPKVRRPKNSLMLSSGVNEIERSRSGVIHVGFGTRWRGPSERWAGEHGIAYGHLHVHLLSPTYEIRTVNGETVKVIENGRLTALDDPEVRELASKYGDPNELLKEDWIPKIPGITMEGSYEEYTRDPAQWMKTHE